MASLTGEHLFDFCGKWLIQQEDSLVTAFERGNFRDYSKAMIDSSLKTLPRGPICRVAIITLTYSLKESS